MRWIMRLFLFLVAGLLIFPFVWSSMLVDQRGIVIPGQVAFKNEVIVVRYSSWTRQLDATIAFQAPDESGLGVMTAGLPIERFDELHKGSVVKLRYLLHKDVPGLPGFKTMRDMHVLPRVRLAEESTWSGLGTAIEQHRLLVITMVLAGLGLLVWGLLRLPYFAFVFIGLVALGGVISLVTSFPRPMPAPARDVRTAAGTIKSLETWKFLFESAHSSSQNRWIADQPVSVTGVEFVPEGGTDPVVAADLIDEGSLPGLKEHSKVTVDYEKVSPRTAYIRGAKRSFAQRNLYGLVTQLLAMLVVTVVFLTAAALFGKFIQRLTRRGT